MSRNYLVLIIGLIVFLLPFLGFPRSLDIFLTTVSGVVLVLVASLSYIRVRLERLQYRSQPPQSSPSTPPPSSVAPSSRSTGLPELPKTP